MKYDEIKRYLGILFSFIMNEFFNGWSVGLNILTKIMLLDFATGYMKGKTNKNLNSRTATVGFLRKVTMLLLVSFGTILDDVLGSGDDISRMMIYYLIGIEGLSILENASVFLPIPPKITQYLEQLKGAGDIDDNIQQ